MRITENEIKKFGFGFGCEAVTICDDWGVAVAMLFYYYRKVYFNNIFQMFSLIAP